MSPSRGTSNRARIATTVLHTEDSIQGKTHFKSSPASYPISLMSFGSAQRQEHNLSGSVWALQLQSWRTCVYSRYAELKVQNSTDDWRLHLQIWTEGVSIRTGTGHPEIHAPGPGRDCWLQIGTDGCVECCTGSADEGSLDPHIDQKPILRLNSSARGQISSSMHTAKSTNGSFE
jgi:hypothetical protein